VPAGDQQAHTLGQRPVVVDVGGEVPAEMVDGVERHSPGGGVGLGGGDADQQRSGKAGTDGGGHDVGLVDAGGGQRAPHGRTQRLQMRPRGDLGHHPAVARVFVDAGGHLVGQ